MISRICCRSLSMQTNANEPSIAFVVCSALQDNLGLSDTGSEGWSLEPSSSSFSVSIAGTMSICKQSNSSIEFDADLAVLVSQDHLDE